MAKLSKAAAKLHRQACDLLAQAELTISEREFVLTHWNEAAEHEVGAAGAFFTPLGLANDFMTDMPTGGRIVDICAGIGHLAFALVNYQGGRRLGDLPDLVCIELNPKYCAIGRKLVPEARWICADALDPDTWADLGRFDAAMTNPPFGAVKTYTSRSPNALGRMEFAVIERAVSVADYVGALIPQNSSPFSYSGSGHFREGTSSLAARFEAKTGIKLRPGCGVDTAFYREDWKNTAPLLECAYWDVEEDGAALKIETAPGVSPALAAKLRRAAAEAVAENERARRTAATTEAATEATRAGAQYVLAGAEKRQAPAKAQLELLF